MQHQDPKLLLHSIIDQNWTAEKVISIFRLLIEKLEKEFLKKVILSTIVEWKILKFIKDPKDIKDFLDFFIDQLEIFLQALFNENSQDEENLLHILSKNEDLTILKHFLTFSCKNIEKPLLKNFIQSTRKDGSNFLHILCSDGLQNPKLLLDIITWIEKNIGLETITKLMKDTTNEGYNVLNVIGRYQTAKVINETLVWLHTRNRQATKKL